MDKEITCIWTKYSDNLLRLEDYTSISTSAEVKTLSSLKSKYRWWGEPERLRESCFLTSFFLKQKKEEVMIVIFSCSLLTIDLHVFVFQLVIIWFSLLKKKIIKRECLNCKDLNHVQTLYLIILFRCRKSEQAECLLMWCSFDFDRAVPSRIRLAVVLRQCQSFQTFHVCAKLVS